MRKNTQITVRVTDELRDKLKQLATDDDRPLASYITRLLQQHVDAKLAKSGKKNAQQELREQ